ncbi:hypothetical protein RB594_001265 [Gaeumannomyces avenae]
MASESIYKPLDPSRQEIRLMGILPFDAEDKSSVISCRIHVVSLLDKPDFGALSYVWGNPADAVEMRVGGAPFKATANLAAALRQAVQHAPRHLAGPGDGGGGGFGLRYWADSIRINQGDMQEKNHQIPLMRPIYSGARLVAGPLGPGDDEPLGAGLGAFDGIYRAHEEAFLAGGSCWVEPGIDLNEELIRIHGAGIENAAAGDSAMEWLKGDGGAAAAGARLLDAIRYLSDRPYFRRVWILQEVVLATSITFMGGGRAVDFGSHEFAPFGIPTLLLVAKLPRCASSPERWQAAQPVLQKCFSMTSLFVSLRHPSTDGSAAREQTGFNYDATNKHDHVYGAFGATGIRAAVDYARPLGEVYAEAVKTALEDGVAAYLDPLLSFGDIGRRPDVPSWAPCPEPFDSGRQFVWGMGSQHGMSDALDREMGELPRRRRRPGWWCPRRPRDPRAARQGRPRPGLEMLEQVLVPDGGGGGPATNFLPGKPRAEVFFRAFCPALVSWVPNVGVILGLDADVACRAAMWVLAGHLLRPVNSRTHHVRDWGFA